MPQQESLANRELPKDAPTSCANLLQEWAAIARARDAAEADIAAHRASNQALGYFAGVLFPPLVLGIDNDDEAKQRLEELQVRRDELIQAGRELRCPQLP
ncbi:MAG TPA: hypothetical protein VFP44_05190 [Usitatibacter sp.]|nr:hypothetical protein [Usitatibacter sp.]